MMNKTRAISRSSTFQRGDKVSTQMIGCKVGNDSCPQRGARECAVDIEAKEALPLIKVLKVEI